MFLKMLVALLVVATGAEALTLEARDNAEACPGERTYCFVVTEGSLDDVAAGTSTNITLLNAGSLEHELVVAPLSAADSERRDTSEDDAIDEIDDVQPGQQKSKVFMIPADAGSLYFWCDIPGHEQLGMWTAQEGEGNGTPMPLLLAVGALVMAAWRRH